MVERVDAGLVYERTCCDLPSSVRKVSGLLVSASLEFAAL